MAEFNEQFAEFRHFFELRLASLRATLNRGFADIREVLAKTELTLERIDRKLDEREVRDRLRQLDKLGTLERRPAGLPVALPPPLPLGADVARRLLDEDRRE